MYAIEYISVNYRSIITTHYSQNISESIKKMPEYMIYVPCKALFYLTCLQYVAIYG